MNGGLAYCWGWFLAHIPTVGGVLAVVGVVVALPIILGAGWIGFWAAIGSWALAPTAGMTIGILSLVGIFAFRKTIGFFLTIAFIAIVIGFCFPLLKEAINRYSQSGQDELANVLDSQSVQMQSQGVMPAVVIEDAVLYNRDGKVINDSVKKGVELRTISLKKYSLGKNPETFINVMLSNAKGEYFDGECGLIPVRKLKLGTTAAEESRKVEEAKRAKIENTDSDADKISRRELEKETAARTAVATTGCQPDQDKGVYCAHIQPGGFDTLQLPAGEYALVPATAQVRWDKNQYKASGGTLSLAVPRLVFFSFPDNVMSGDITITKKPPS
ncbi:MAG TPA: hypothetical protein DCS28_03570 [Candidatus Moranbacteria bacterium]|nr:hypothetical protein [Candidatus Moranbacteria bacterium]HAT75091.1 hypothetical protein [Candidatus Moranbacteria bacterium]